MKRIGLVVAMAVCAQQARAQPVNQSSPRAASSSDNVLPSNLESTLYLRERAPQPNEASHERERERLEKLIERRQQQIEARRSEAIERLERFVATEPEAAPEMPDALLRLAELKWEVSRDDYLRRFARWQKTNKARRGPAPTRSYGKTLALYDRLIERHGDYSRIDLVLYMKAFALVELERGEEALTLYQAILQQHPKSRFVPDAHFALAEAAFSGQGNPRGALKHYEAVLQYPESELRDISLFKAAWTLWKLGRRAEAARRFRRVLDLGRQTEGLTVAQRKRLQDLQDEALDYLIQVFIEDERNSAADLFAFLEEIGGEEYAERVLVRLSDTYLGQARYQRAVEAYKLLLELDPTVAAAPEYRERIAEAYATMGRPKEVMEALSELASRYAPGTKWARQQGDPELVKRTRLRAERAVRAQALDYHERGQQENDREVLERASNLYGIHLEHFPDAPAAYDIQFYRGEILFHRLKQFAPAGEAYLAAAQLKPKGKYTRDALYNAIGAFEKVREEELEDCDAPSSKGAVVCEETANDRKFSQAIELYVELFPNDPDLPEILFRQGRLYYDRGVYDPAVRLWGQLLDKYPKSQYAEPAGQLILDSFNRAKDYANIEKWARRLKDAPSFRSAKSQKRLNQLIIQSMFKVGEQLADEEKHVKAAQAYERAAREFPKEARARQALYNAGVQWQKAHKLQEAADAYDALIRRYPGSNEGAKGAWRAAQMFESIVQFRDAAKRYAAYAQRFGAQPRAPDALYNAVVLRFTAGDYAEAVRLGKAFVKKHPKHEAATEIYFLIGKSHEEQRKWRRAAATYRHFVGRSRDVDATIEAYTRLAEVLQRAGNRRGADKALRTALRLADRNRSRLQGGLYYAAKARYLQGDQILHEYEKIKIDGNVSGLRRRLEKKSALLQKAAEVYTEVLRYNVAEWVTAALHQIGRSYETFSEAMRDAPVPSGFSEQEKQVYRDQLAMFIVPMEERALQAYEGGYEKSIELRIFNEWTAKLREALTRLNDVQYPPLKEMGAKVVTGTTLPDPGPLTSLKEGARRVAEASR